MASAKATSPFAFAVSTTPGFGADATEDQAVRAVVEEDVGAFRGPEAGNRAAGYHKPVGNRSGRGRTVGAECTAGDVPNQ